eukprot:2438955-Rhodomonas_salina.1
MRVLNFGYSATRILIPHFATLYIVLRFRYALCGTELAFAPTQYAVLVYAPMPYSVLTWPIILWLSYALCGTELAYAPTRARTSRR